MKKHRKLVALLIALTFLFSVVAPAMAADVDAAQISADKLNVLGIIEGYPDGSFGLDQNITRAEFAKIAVAAAGLTEAAEQLVNFPSQFSDVKVGEWYTGWINMAASQGFVKGDPAGTFRPNDNITYAEVVTVLVRLLGYDDNLTGPWPTNYLAKAVELDITEGVALNASAPAVRGDVFVMTDNTLDCRTVYWNADNLDWTVKDSKLIVKSFEGVMEEGIVTDISWDSKGDMYLDLVDNDGKNLGSLKLVDNVIVTGAEDAYGLLGKQVEFVKNQKESGSDRNAIVYLGAKDTDSVSDDEAEYTGRYIEVDSKKYDVASGFGVTFFPVDDYFDEDEAVTLTGDKVEVVFNEDGEAQWAFVYDFANPDVIEEVDGDRVYGYNHVRIEYDEDDVQVFIKDGAMVSFDDLAEGDLVYVYEDDERNTDLLVFAVSEVMEGELESAHKNWDYLTIDGTKIDTDSDRLVSNDGGDSYYDFLNDDMFDDTVKYMLSPAGKIAVVISGAASENMVGVVEAVDTDNISGPKVRMVTADGSKAIYTVDSDYYKEDRASDNSVWEDIINGIDPITNSYVLVEYTLDSSGKIDSVSVDGTVSYQDYDGSRAKIGDKWYRVLSNAAFFGLDNKNKIVDTDWDTFKVAKENDVQIIWSKGAVKAMYIGSQIVDTDNIGVIAGSGRDGGKGYYYDVFVDGEKVRYNLTNSVVKSTIAIGNGETEEGYDLAKGTVIEFDLSDGKISKLTVPDATASGLVAERGGDYIYVEGDGYYYFDEDTMIVDVTKSTKRIVSSVARDDYVNIYEEKDGIVDLVVIAEFDVPEQLDALIAKVETLDEADYDADSWDALENALANAEDVLEDRDATAQELADALAALQAAYEDLEEAVAGEGVVTYIDAADKAVTDDITLVSTDTQKINVLYNNDSNKLVSFEANKAKLYVEDSEGNEIMKVENSALDINPGASKELFTDLSLTIDSTGVAADQLHPGKSYTVKLLLDGELQEETLAVYVKDNDTSIDKVVVDGIEATGSYSVQLPLGVKAEDVTIEASDIKLNSAKAKVIELAQDESDKTKWTFKVEAEDGTQSAVQTITLVETKIDGSNSSASISAKVVTVTVLDDTASNNPVKGLAKSDFVFKLSDGTAVDIADFVESNTQDGVYVITLDVEDSVDLTGLTLEVDGVAITIS